MSTETASTKPSTPDAWGLAIALAYRDLNDAKAAGDGSAAIDLVADALILTVEDAAKATGTHAEMLFCTMAETIKRCTAPNGRQSMGLLVEIRADIASYIKVVTA